ncbi:hypothetical protein [Chromobacterium vaccinii]|uniref:hypothetical protein n=1 Tax=Chromobacterium piscinae TaxID=686831 RepID=UPI001C8CD077|nr:hypothetical protein [Chromobacterium vaccinii]MBX9357763.1 hypothetical protein [Chromobacterium vaccinii]
MTAPSTIHRMEFKMLKNSKLFIKQMLTDLPIYGTDIIKKIDKTTMQRILHLKPEDQLVIDSETHIWGGHKYAFINRIMPPKNTSDLSHRALDSFMLMLGRPTILDSTDEDRVATFGTGDKVFAPTSGEFSIDTELAGEKITGGGLTAITTDCHALNGALAHACIKTDNCYFMARAGKGQFPVPFISGPVDYMNCKLGTLLWQKTDWIYDYFEHGREKFKAFYGEDVLEQVDSILEANSYNWVSRKNESFLGTGEGTFLGNPYGSSGDMLIAAINLGFTTRWAQEKWLKYKSKN